MPPRAGAQCAAVAAVGVVRHLFSALIKDKCTLAVGASGAVFEMIGLFVSDSMLNFETIRRSVLLL
jgi:membrane associated rhomboid family serine protease